MNVMVGVRECLVVTVYKFDLLVVISSRNGYSYVHVCMAYE